MLSYYISTNHGHLGHHSDAILRREYRSKYTSSASRSKASQGRKRGWSYIDGRKPVPTVFQEPSSLSWTLSASTVSIQCCEMCGNGDGILPCDRCFGAGIVPTEPGGAGVPFYIGNARCSSCGGHGFTPCPLCVGFTLRMPRPDPVAGPCPTEDMDVLTDSISWLKQFPDSRMIARKRADCSHSGGSAMTRDPVQPAQDTADNSVLAFHFYAMHAHLTRRGSQ